MKAEKPKRLRADLLMVERGLAPSREKAKALIMAGLVKADGLPVEKAGQQLPEDVCIEVTQRIPYVGWGGVKLSAAIEGFNLDVKGKVAADFGASTGGFTHCLLLNGARLVYAVDVGYGQLDPSLRRDPRVVVMEKTNVRHLTGREFGEEISLLTADLSFISLTKVLPVIREVLSPGGQAVLLVKPQFEVGKGQVGKGGIVKDPAMQDEAVERVASCAQNLGFKVAGRMEAPRQREGKNREFLLLLEKPWAGSGE